jgi:hypothetical protein
MKKDSENASLYISKLKEQAAAPHGYTADSYLFLMSAVTGDADRAFDWVVKAIDNSLSLPVLCDGTP